MSRNSAEFDIIGHVVRKVPLNNLMKLQVASNFTKKVNDDWVEDVRYNTVNIWRKNDIDYINEHVDQGDLVRIRGNISEKKHTDSKSGEDVYTVELDSTSFARLAKKQSE